jgi:hypothetical protein
MISSQAKFCIRLQQKKRGRKIIIEEDESFESDSVRPVVQVRTTEVCQGPERLNIRKETKPYFAT